MQNHHLILLSQQNISIYILFMHTLYNSSHHNSRRNSASTSNLSNSQSKRKYLQVLSRPTPDKTSHQQLRSSAVSLPVNQQNHNYRQRIRGDDDVKLIRCSSVHSQNHMVNCQTRYRHCTPSPQPRVIVRQVIKTVPVNFHYPNQPSNSLPLKPSYQNPKHPIKTIFETPSKSDIVLHSMMNNRPIAQNFNSQSASGSIPIPFQPFYCSHIPSEQFRFSLNPKTQQNKRSSQNISMVPCKRNDSENVIKYQKEHPTTSQAQSQTKLSNQIYMKKQLEEPEPELPCSSNNTKVPQDPQPNSNSNKKISEENLNTTRQNIEKYNSLTITKQDRQSNLKENLEIGKNCLCKKILQFTKCEDIKIKKNSTNKRQVLQPKKNLLP